MIVDWIGWGERHWEQSTTRKEHLVKTKDGWQNPFSRVRLNGFDKVVQRARQARLERKELLGATPLEVVRLDESGCPKDRWLVVRKTITGYDLSNLHTGEYLPNVHPSQPILEVSELEVVVEQ